MKTRISFFVLLLHLHHSHPFQTASHNLARQQPHHDKHYLIQGAISEEIELYNDNGDEIDVQLDTLEVRDNSLNDGDDQEVNDKKLIECNASILLPFGADVAFDAFSDLTRQPSWCKYLKSVEYVGLVEDEMSQESVQVPLRQSKWTVSVKGLRFSWTAKDTSIIRPKSISWESTSGMKNSGCVEFTPHYENINNTTLMKLSFRFVTPRVVSSLFRRSTLIRSYTEDVLLMGMLMDFRDVVLQEDISSS